MDDGELLETVQMTDKVPSPHEAMLDLDEHNGKVFCTGYSKVNIKSGNMDDRITLFAARVDFFGVDETIPGADAIEPEEGSRAPGTTSSTSSTGTTTVSISMVSIK